ncbi:MAG: phosphatase PAP2 family protein [Rickettsiaceae bacterium]
MLQLYDVAYNWLGLNQYLFLEINKITNIGILPSLLQFTSHFFDIFHFSIYYIMICLYYYITFRNNQAKLSQKALEKVFWSKYNHMILIGTTYVMLGCTYAFLKFSINFPRPFCSIKSYYTVANIDAERCLSGFPSAHIAIAVLILYCFKPCLSKMQTIFGIIIIVLVGLSRISLAMHYPADLLYSILFMIFIIYLSKIFVSIFKNNIVKYIGNMILTTIVK